jgi:hypothetical protein
MAGAAAFLLMAAGLLGPPLASLAAGPHLEAWSARIDWRVSIGLGDFAMALFFGWLVAAASRGCRGVVGAILQNPAAAVPEVRTLTDPRIRETIEALGIRLVSYADYAAALPI